MKKESVSKRKQRALQTKMNIFEAARHLILKHGVENVSVDSIVKVAGVSKGAFYVHYESKDSLLADLVNNYTNIADVDYKSFLTSFMDHSSVIDILMQLAEKISEFIEYRIGIDNMRALYKAHLTKTVDTTSAMSHSRGLYKLIREVLEKGVNQGELRADIPVDSLAKHLVLSQRVITFEWCVRYPDFNLKEQVLDHYKILIQGIKNQSSQ